MSNTTRTRASKTWPLTTSKKCVSFNRLVLTLLGADLWEVWKVIEAKWWLYASHHTALDSLACSCRSNDYSGARVRYGTRSGSDGILPLKLRL
jgi:hypothetical protein